MVSLVSWIFFNSIVGVFGFATISLEAFNNLRESEAIVESMRDRHQKKKANLNKKVGKRASKRVATSALAAATVGTVVVTTAVAGFEAEDYCQERRALLDDQRLLFPDEDVEEFSYEQCFDSALSDMTDATAELTDKSLAQLKSIWESLGEVTDQYYEELKAQGLEALERSLKTLKSLLPEEWLAE